MDSGLAALLGATISGVVALGVQMLAVTMSAKAKRRAQLSKRLSDYLASTHAFVLAAGQVARAENVDKPSVEADRVWNYNDSANAAFAEIELHDTPELVAAAQALDSARVELMRLARERKFDREQWRAERERVIHPPLSGYKVVGRRHVQE